MNQIKTFAAAALLASSTLAISCSTNEQTGQVLGGVAGAAAGSQVGGGSGRTAATVGGAVLGAFIGGEVGSRMDEDDLRQTGQVLENNEIGQSTAWVNPDTGYRYDLQPTNTYQSASGPCRDYEMQAVIDGRNETIHGTACRQDDGSWE
ncbi:MAG: glycine zipper 2TM domain-containing protein [Pseudohongiellaceae bacterium]